GAKKKNMIKRLTTVAGCLNENFKLLAYAMLADVFAERSRAQGALNRLLIGRSDMRGDNALWSRSAGERVGMYGHGVCAEYIYSVMVTDAQMLCGQSQ